MRIGIAGTGRIGSFHARTLSTLDAVESLVLYDPYLPGAQGVATEVGASGLPTTVAPDVPALLASDLDAFVITSATSTHAELLRAAVEQGLPTFCEKPVAVDLAGSVELATQVAGSSVPVQVGFQRRFDAGYTRLREAISSGELGFVHTLRGATHDRVPPHADYVPTSGGIFRDCAVHEFDILRFLTGCEAVSVYAAGSNKGEPFFRAAGDVDSAAAIVTLDDATVATITVTRYNGAGQDVRMEAHGSEGSMAVGLDETLAFRSAEPGADWPPGPTHQSFMDRFEPAYRAELAVFVEVAAGRRESPCTVTDALQAFRVAEACTISREQGRAVSLAEVDGIE